MTSWRRTVGTFAPFYQTHSESETHSSALTQQGCMNESTIMLMGRLRASRITTRMAKDQESKRKGKASGGGCHLEIDVFALSLCSNRWRIWHRGQMRTCSGLMAERPSEAMETHSGKSMDIICEVGGALGVLPAVIYITETWQGSHDLSLVLGIVS